MATAASPIPQSLRPIAHYVNIAKENVSRDPVIYYWCLFYAVQTGMNLDKKSKEALTYLTSLISTLEAIKKQLTGQEAISQEMVAQAHIENFAMKLFEYADKNDRQSNFSKAVIKAFYTAGYLIDVLTLFGELDENLVVARKYSKWKAAYICNCLKKGETPVPGPAGGKNEENSDLELPLKPDGRGSPAPNPAVSALNPSSASVKPEHHEDSVTPKQSFVAASTASSDVCDLQSAKIKVEDLLEAQKYAKYAVSALSYEDVKTAMENLEKAMEILKNY